MMNSPSFQQQIEEERNRLAGKRSELEARRANIDEEIGQIDLELKAIDAYERARSGKRAAGGGGKRTSRRAEIIQIVESHSPTGIGRAELLVALGVKGDRAAEQAVSNALANLKRGGKLQNDDGVWRAISG